MKRDKLQTEGLSIRFKTTITFGFAILFTVSAVAIFSIWQSQKALTDTVKKSLAQVAALKSEEYEVTFTRVREELESAVHYAKEIYQRKNITRESPVPTLWNWNEKTKNYKWPKRDKGKRIIREKQILYKIAWMLKSVIASNDALSLGYMSTASGMTIFDNETDVLDIRENEKGFNAHKRLWYLKAVEMGSLIWTDPYVDVYTGNLYTTCAIPVYLDNNTFVGVMGFDVLSNKITNDILAIDIGYNSHAFLVGNDGTALATPSLSRRGAKWDDIYKSDILDIYKNDILTNTQNNDYNRIIGDMIWGQSGVSSYMYQNQEIYIAFATIPSANASIGIVADKNEVIKEAKDLQMTLGYVWVGALVFALLWGLISGGRISKPIKRLTIMAEKISQGQTNLESLKEDRKDEIGALTKSFNRLVMSLRLAMSRLKK